MKGIVCPNHGAELDGIGFPVPKKGTGICPISGCPFDFEADVDEEANQVDTSGKVSKAMKWNVTGDEDK